MAYPKCPYCNHEFDADDIWHTGSTKFPTEDDGDVEDTRCLSCDALLRIMLSLEPSWTFLDGDDNEIGS